jgi:hypothetical protein
MSNVTASTYLSTIVTRPRGSWKWQNAYAVATYAPHLTRDGRWVWKLAHRTRKMSAPQLRGTDLPRGGRHMAPMTDDQLIAAGLLHG